jgi:hypothetical protein
MGLMANVILRLWMLFFVFSFFKIAGNNVPFFKISVVLSICFSIIQISYWLKPKWF